MLIAATCAHRLRRGPTLGVQLCRTLNGTRTSRFQVGVVTGDNYQLEVSPLRLRDHRSPQDSWRSVPPISGSSRRLRRTTALYCIAAYPVDHVGDSAIHTTRLVPDSGDYLESIRQTSPGKALSLGTALDDFVVARASAKPSRHTVRAWRTDIAVPRRRGSRRDTEGRGLWKRGRTCRAGSDRGARLANLAGPTVSAPRLRDRPCRIATRGWTPASERVPMIVPQ